MSKICDGLRGDACVAGQEAGLGNLCGNIDGGQSGLDTLISHMRGLVFHQFQKYKGRVALRGDIVKDNSGAYAVFTEQRSSASQQTAAKVMDVI